MTRQQDWARHALAAVSELAGTPDEKEYRTRCMTGPALIQQSGLAQAVTFLLSKTKRSEDSAEPKETTYRLYCRHLAGTYGLSGEQPEKELCELALEAKLPEYLALTRDLLEVSIWFRRFALSELESEAGVN